MKYFKIFFILILVASCNKKNVQLPIIGEKGITNVHNNSSVWMFFNVINNDTVAVLNKNNKITNTHLIFNIDKRLPLRVVVPKLHEIQENLKKDSPHKSSETMHNYFNYADTLSNTFALFDFTNTFYLFTKEEFENTILNIHKEKIRNPIIINFKKESIIIENKKTNDLINKINFIISNDSIKNRTLFLTFDKYIPYQKYLKIKTKLLDKGFKIENAEYIYSEE